LQRTNLARREFQCDSSKPVRFTSGRNSTSNRSIQNRRKSNEIQHRRKAQNCTKKKPGSVNEVKSRNGVKSNPYCERKAKLSSNRLAYFVLIPTVVLILTGLVMVFSAGSVIGMNMNVGGYRFFLQQALWAVLGLILLVFFSRFDYHKLGKLSWPGVILSIVLLAMVVAMGRMAGGARRWLILGGINLQPTEIAKFTLIIFVAYTLSVKGKHIKKFSHLVIPVVLILLVEGALIMFQPDMGSAIVLALSVGLLLIVGGARLSHIAILGASGATASFVLMLAEPYRKVRLFSFINPWKSPRGYGYQVIQSLIALGTGHISGLGLGMSRQKFLYLPNAHTDFIFAIIGEELGLVGTLGVVFFVAILGYAGFMIARKAPDDLGRLLAVGITGLIVIQSIINMGGVTGLLPITGVPLPLVSFGGSSLCVCMGCIGVLLNISASCNKW